MQESYKRKVIISGNVVEIYDYEKAVDKTCEQRKVGRGNSSFTTEETKRENRKKVANRARNYVKRKANANPQLNKFLTLTYKENMTDVNKARKDFDKFVKRVKTRYKDFSYIAVPEFQKRGALHFHLLCNLPFVNVHELAQVWGYGYIKINRLDNVDNVGAYITKYMTKENIDERLIGRKCYSMSKGLNEPSIYTDETDIENILAHLETVKRINTYSYETEHYGEIRYTQIVCFGQIKKPRRHADILQKLRSMLTPLPDNTPNPFLV